MLLLLWPCCWEHHGVQTETPSPRAALLGLMALGGCQVGQRCPIPSAAAQGFKGQRLVIAVTSGSEGAPVSMLVLVPPSSWWSQRTGTGWPGEGTGRQVGRWQVGGDVGGCLYLGDHVHPAQQCHVSPCSHPPPTHGTGQRQSVTPGPQPSHSLLHSGTDRPALGASSAAAGSLLREEALEQHHLPDADHEEDEGFPH